MRLFVSAILLLLASPALADRVEPRADVTRLTVRLEPTVASPALGSLWQGRSAELLKAVPSWYRVRLASGEVGYVSERWSVARPEVAFSVHFLDVGSGDAAIIDMGDREIVIDGGASIRTLHDYAEGTGLIDGAIELAVVTRSDAAHWKGLRRLLDFDGRATTPQTILEYWDAGYDRGCQPMTSYDTFVGAVSRIHGVRFRRPLERTHTPAVASGRPVEIVLPSLPGIEITVLHADATPAEGADCETTISNAALVLMIEIEGIRMLFSGDANPSAVDRLLVEFQGKNLGALDADLWKVPGSAGATVALVDGVSPRWVIVSADIKHPADDLAYQPFRKGVERTILRTDRTPESGIDHIMCTLRPGEPFSCDFVAP